MLCMLFIILSGKFIRLLHALNPHLFRHSRGLLTFACFFIRQKELMVLAPQGNELEKSFARNEKENEET